MVYISKIKGVICYLPFNTQRLLFSSYLLQNNFFVVKITGPQIRELDLTFDSFII